MFLKRENKLISYSSLLVVFLSLFLFGINILIELNTYFPSDSFLIARSVIAIIIFHLLLISQKKIQKKWIKTASVLWLLLFLTNIILNIINVYNLDKYNFVNIFCNSNSNICEAITSLFYKLKIFRFITLSSYFFTIPILILFFYELNFDFKKKDKKRNLLKKFFFIILSIIIFSNLLICFQRIYLSVIQTFQLVDESYYDRFTFKKGGVSYYGWIRVFSNFVIEQTSEDINILVPPQSDTYKMEGNINYFRWFMYPRKLYHLDDLTSHNAIKIDYIIISAGECDDRQCVWPNYAINQKEINRILLINRETQKITIKTNIDYLPENFYQKWGLIELN